jgi:fibronectin type 3 domain-containing protein
LSTAVHGSAQAPPVSVVVSWNASASTNVTGYNVYRATASGGPYGKLTSAPTTSLNFTDTTVVSGQVYYYIVTAVGANSVESPYSQEVVAKP